MAKVISSLISLVLIGAVLFGAKVMYFDDLMREKKISEVRTEILRHTDNGEVDKALALCDDFESKYPNQKSFCNGQRAEIYRDILDNTYSKVIDADNLRTKALRAKNKDSYRKNTIYLEKYARECLDVLEDLEACDDFTKEDEKIRLNVYLLVGDRKKAEASAKRHADMQ